MTDGLHEHESIYSLARPELSKCRICGKRIKRVGRAYRILKPREIRRLAKRGFLAAAKETP